MGSLLLTGAIALAPLPALAQQAPPPASAPADSVGPKALQNFSLSGTVTRAADQPVPLESASPHKPQPRAEAESVPAPAGRKTASAPAVRPARMAAAAPPPAKTQALPPPQPEPSSAAAAPANPAPAVATTVPAAAPIFAPPPPPGALASGHGLPLLPWLLAAFALVLGGAFLFWRSRAREAYAGSAQFDLFTAPEPAPEAAPPPMPGPPPPETPKPPPAATAGVVSARLRPWIDIGFLPVRCILEDKRVIVEFDVELFNSGSAPARAVLVEAALFNAGPAQDAQIGGFFANPVGNGERIAVIPPLKRVPFRSQVIAPREQVQAYELAGQQVFVPVIAFNALYGWSGGEGQTSVSYLLGRDTKGDKLGPFRLDLGPHIFRGLAARLLPSGVRK